MIFLCPRERINKGKDEFSLLVSYVITVWYVERLTIYRYLAILIYSHLYKARAVFMTMSRLKYYRMEAGLSVAQLARLAQVDETTCRRAETGKPVQELKAYAIAKALSQAYGQELTIEVLEIVIYS